MEEKRRMDMITFDELREQTTPDIIKKMVELAEGFEWLEIGNWTGYCYNGYYNYWDNFETTEFPLLLHRAVEGWNKDKKGEDCIVISDDNLVLWRADLDDCKVYDFKDYQPCHLTACEMAIMDCLIEVLK